MFFDLRLFIGSFDIFLLAKKDGSYPERLGKSGNYIMLFGILKSFNSNLTPRSYYLCFDS